MGNGMNSLDQAIGNCNWSACMRDHLVDTMLSEPAPAAGSADPRAINDNGEIVGSIAHYSGTGGYSSSPVRWADANAPYEEFSALGASNEEAIDVNNHGVVDIGTMFGLAHVKVVGISDDGVVAGFVTDGGLYSQTMYGFSWTADGGMISLGAQSVVMDIARNGDMTGHIGARSYLWRGGKAIDLNKALNLDPADNFVLTSGLLINDQGTIVSYGAYYGYQVLVVLVPNGAGCVVCLAISTRSSSPPAT
jgi:hypothetical protein